ncbi:DUF2510 domain-containing protein, partial [Streptomyces sp. NPDC057540]|uniref:DUF2510 domain-containing protein n=1 Tax=Streptomyces sp. NPDC057540 TaxID=3346160 RepID=UPI0036942EA1
MATPPGGGGEVPQAGYYPDPSIPGYIRFWNGGAWVPGTSRPAPAGGEVPPGPPASAIPAGPILASGPAPAPVAAPAQAVETARSVETPASFPEQAPFPEQASFAEPTPITEQASFPEPTPFTEPTPLTEPTPAPVPDPAPVQRSVAPPVQTSAHVPAQAQAPAPLPVPTVEETGPVFFDEEPLAPEPASAWQADSARQTGFGGDRDQKVSWGAPRTPDPRTPADWPVAGGSEPDEARAAAPAPAADPRVAGGAARLGGMPVTPNPTPPPPPPPPPPAPPPPPPPPPAPPPPRPPPPPP